ncbi:MAG: hypothetical protein ACRCST_12015 [Turicibacter sp.]
MKRLLEQFENSRMSDVILFGIAFLTLIFMRDWLGFNIHQIVMTLFFVISFIYLPVEKVVILLALMMPFKGGLPMHEIMLLATGCIGLKYIKDLRFDLSLIPIIGIVMLETINIISGGQVLMVMKLGIYLLFVSLILMYLKNLSLDYKAILSTFVLGTFSSALTVFFITVRQIGLHNMLNTDVRLGNTLSLFQNHTGMITMFNSNELALYLILGLAVGCLLLLKSNVSKISLAIQMIGLVGIGLFTQSRTFIITLVFLIILVCIYFLKRPMTLLLILGMGGILTAIVWMQYSDIVTTLFNQIIMRFDVVDISNGRNELLVQYNDIILGGYHNFFIGNGLFNYYPKFGLENVTHNGIQEIFLAWGCIGFVFAIQWIGSLFAHIKVESFVNVIPVIIFIVFIQTIQFFSSFGLILLLIILYCCLNLKKSIEV